MLLIVAYPNGCKELRPFLAREGRALLPQKGTSIQQFSRSLGLLWTRSRKVPIRCSRSTIWFQFAVIRDALTNSCGHSCGQSNRLTSGILGIVGA